MNDLSSAKWLSFTKTWFVINPPARLQQKVIHPATFPGDLVSGFINFFTRPGDWVLDPFLGSGTTTKVAISLNRSSVGVELNPVMEEHIKDYLATQQTDMFLGLPEVEFIHVSS
jgi:site-specific DNA-methyltransferase (cytosine-N4-specific)